MQLLLLVNLVALHCVLQLFSQEAPCEEIFFSNDSCHLCPENIGNLSFAYTVGDYISIDKNYAQFGVVLPVSFSSSLVFLDANAYRFDDSKWAFSLGGGIRKEVFCDILGLNAYYDNRYGQSKYFFHQIGIGGEWLSSCWSARINTYFSVPNKTYSFDLCRFNHLGDGYYASRKRLEYAYSGFDAEFGTPQISCSDFNFYGGVGSYYFYKSNFNHFWGFLGRVEVSWKSIVILKVKTSYDHINQTRVQGFIGFSLPIESICSFWNLNCCDTWLTQAVRRNGIVLTDSCCNWCWNW